MTIRIAITPGEPAGIGPDLTEQAKRNRAHQLLFNRKFKEESFNWQQEMREQAHVDIFPTE